VIDQYSGQVGRSPRVDFSTLKFDLLPFKIDRLTNFWSKQMQNRAIQSRNGLFDHGLSSRAASSTAAKLQQLKAAFGLTLGR